MTRAGYVPHMSRMTTHSPPSLRQRLLAAANAWAVATGRTLGGLSAKVANHGHALDRLADPDKAVTDATLEKFARFLVDPANWPNGAVAKEAVDLAHVVGVNTQTAPASAIKDDRFSPDLAQGQCGGCAA